MDELYIVMYYGSSKWWAKHLYKYNELKYFINENFGDDISVFKPEQINVVILMFLLCFQH